MSAANALRWRTVLAARLRTTLVRELGEHSGSRGRDRPRGDDMPLPGARSLTELDGERGQDNDLSALVDRLDRLCAGAAEHRPHKQRIVRLRRPRRGDQGAVPYLPVA
jgi:hypothetical protein